MKRGIAVLLALIVLGAGWLFATLSGKMWRLKRTSIADLTVLSISSPQDTTIFQVLTEKLISEGRFEEAATSYSGWAAATPSDSLPLQKQGEALIRANRLADAVTALEGAVSLDAKNTEAVAQLGYALYLLGKTSQAEERIDALLNTQPSNGSANAVKAFLFAERHQFNSAKTALQKADAAQRNSSLYLSAKGYVADKEGDNISAILAYQEAVKQDASNGQVWVWLSSVLIRVANTPEDYAKANQALQKATALLPHAPLIPYAQGQLALKQGDFNNAIAQFQQALSLSPNSTETLYQLSIAYERAGRKAESDTTQKRFEKVNAYQRTVNNLQIRIGHEPNSLALWKSLLKLAQENDDPERAQLAQERVAKLSQAP